MIISSIARPPLHYNYPLYLLLWLIQTYLFNSWYLKSRSLFGLVLYLNFNSLYYTFTRCDNEFTGWDPSCILMDHTSIFYWWRVGWVLIYLFSRATLVFFDLNFHIMVVNTFLVWNSNAPRNEALSLDSRNLDPSIVHGSIWLDLMSCWLDSRSLQIV